MYQDADGTIERRYEMCAYIKAAKYIRYEELMNLFKVSRTTVYRDLDYIQKHMLLPIIRTPGNQGGIFLDLKKKIEPLPFTIEEVIVLMAIHDTLDGKLKYQLENIIVNHVDMELMPEELKYSFHFFRC